MLVAKMSSASAVDARAHHAIHKDFLDMYGACRFNLRWAAVGTR